MRMATLGMITIDVQDERAAAEWWRERLAAEYVGQYPGFTILSLPGTSVHLGFQQVAEPTSGKNRVHLDLESAADRTSEIEHFVAAGATVLETHGGGEEFGWSVLRDPFGVIFCLSDPH